MYKSNCLVDHISLEFPLNLNELDVSADWQGTTGPRETYATTVTPKMMMMSKRYDSVIVLVFFSFHYFLLSSNRNGFFSCVLAGVAVVCSRYLQGENAPRPHSRSDNG